MSFENEVSKLIEKRKILNNSSNFQEISEIWLEIKTIYEKCKKEINEIKENINLLNENNENEEKLTLSFEELFSEIKIIAEKIKSCSISELPDNIKRLQLLKQNCLRILKEEKCKIQEVK